MRKQINIPKQVQDELRAARNWKMADDAKKANAFLKSAFAGLKAEVFGAK